MLPVKSVTRSKWPARFTKTCRICNVSLRHFSSLCLHEQKTSKVYTYLGKWRSLSYSKVWKRCYCWDSKGFSLFLFACHASSKVSVQSSPPKLGAQIISQTGSRVTLLPSSLSPFVASSIPLLVNRLYRIFGNVQNIQMYYRCPGTRYAFVSRFKHPLQTTGNEANISAWDRPAGWPQH